MKSYHAIILIISLFSLGLKIQPLQAINSVKATSNEEDVAVSELASFLVSVSHFNQLEAEGMVEAAQVSLKNAKPALTPSPTNIMMFIFAGKAAEPISQKKLDRISHILNGGGSTAGNFPMKDAYTFGTVGVSLALKNVPNNVINNTLEYIYKNNLTPSQIGAVVDKIHMSPKVTESDLKSFVQKVAKEKDISKQSAKDEKDALQLQKNSKEQPEEKDSKPQNFQKIMKKLFPSKTSKVDILVKQKKSSKDLPSYSERMDDKKRVLRH